MIIGGTEDWKFLPEIKIEPKGTVLPKKRYSTFFETDLETTLRSRGIQDLIISEVMTNLCCETTARDAFMRDYRVFFLIDGTATGRSELRMVNTGSTPFVFFAVYPGDAGHNYGDIEKTGFVKILVEREGKPLLIDNPRWKKRD